MYSISSPSSDRKRHSMTMLLTTVMTPPEKVLVKKSSLTFG